MNEHIIIDLQFIFFELTRIFFFCKYSHNFQQNPRYLTAKNLSKNRITKNVRPPSLTYSYPLIFFFIKPARDTRGLGYFHANDLFRPRQCSLRRTINRD